MQTRKIILVRHGESVSNRNRTITGQGDAPLTRNGRTEAKRAARFITRKFGRSIDLIISSPLSRARATANCIADRVRASIEVNGALMEADFGRWEGKKMADIRLEPGWEEYEGDPFHFSFPGGECVQDVKKRALSFKSKLLVREGWRTAVVVSHYTPIVFLMLSVIGDVDTVKSPFKIENASVSIVEIDGDRETLGLVNYKP
ncbi:MAG: histidine phosphatase family protein [Spirochaetes bacterium]|nr:histidine phosphatase family protein [Spirochaetota bacterium]